MKWNRKRSDVTYNNPVFEMRKGLLFLPKCCGVDWRWLEHAKWDVKLWRSHSGNLYTDMERWID